MVTGSRNEWPRIACAMTGVASLWFLSSPIFGHMGPPRPCLLAGAVLGVLAWMFSYNPGQHRGWGTLVVLTSVLSFLLGAGAIVPGFLGVTGGVLAAMWNPPDA